MHCKSAITKEHTINSPGWSKYTDVCMTASCFHSFIEITTRFLKSSTSRKLNFSVNNRHFIHQFFIIFNKPIVRIIRIISIEHFIEVLIPALFPNVIFGHKDKSYHGQRQELHNLVCGHNTHGWTYATLRHQSQYYNDFRKSGSTLLRQYAIPTQGEKRKLNDL